MCICKKVYRCNWLSPFGVACIYIDVWLCLCASVCVCVYMCRCICVYVCVCLCMNMHMCGVCRHMHMCVVCIYFLKIYLLIMYTMFLLPIYLHAERGYQMSLKMFFWATMWWELWELNLGLLEEQPVFLTSEPSLQPWCVCILRLNVWDLMRVQPWGGLILPFSIVFDCL